MHNKKIEKVDLTAKSVIRVMTYNIHSCVDANRNINPCSISGIIQEQNADIIALQEVDAQKPFHTNRNQAGIIADDLGMNYVYFPAETTGLRAFGLAVLSRYPIHKWHRNCLPSLFPRLKPRKRAAIRACIHTPAGPINIINAHLSLFKLERRKQLNALLGKDWLSAVAENEPVIICGDLNAGPLSGTYRKLSRFLTDVQMDNQIPRAFSAKPTFHAKSPLFRIDHIFISNHFHTLNVEVRSSPDTQTASDHLPLIADLAINPPLNRVSSELQHVL
jgi:endonuclease/exonuclease/phosphatase family metal-dependent hydrolase